MSDNYVKFAEVIRHLTPEEEKFLKEKFEAAKDICDKQEEEDPGYDAPYLCEEFEFDTDRHGDDDGWGRYFYFHSEECGGDFDALGVIFTEFLKKFRPDQMIVISYSETCSKPAVESFSGGGIVITVYGVKTINARDYLIRKGKKILEKGVE